MDDANAPHLGEAIAGYRLVKLLGEGALAWVYKGVHTVLERPAAIKIIKPEIAENPANVRRYLNEAKAVNGLRHPNIVDISEFVQEGHVAIIMEFLSGPTLERVLSKRAFSPRQATNICLQILHALQAAHAENVIHRDLKPSNLILVPGESSDLSHKPSVKILDFAITEIVDVEGYKTASGIMVGAPAYMAPEQLLGRYVGPAADIYALACLYYEMLVGRRLFDTKASKAAELKTSSESTELTLDCDFPAKDQVLWLISQTLKKKGKERPTPKDWWKSLMAILAEQPKAPPVLPRAPRDSWLPPKSVQEKLIADGPAPPPRANTRGGGPAPAPVATGPVLGPRLKILFAGGLAASLALAVFIGRRTAPEKVKIQTIVKEAPKPPPSKLVRVEVMSTPPARVIDKPTGALLGTSPIGIDVKRGETREVVLKASGFKDKELVLQHEQLTYEVELEDAPSSTGGSPAADPNRPLAETEMPEW